jgi:hypothetical protein
VLKIKKEGYRRREIFIYKVLKTHMTFRSLSLIRASNRFALHVIQDEEEPPINLLAAEDVEMRPKRLTKIEVA